MDARRMIRCGDAFHNKPIINPIMMRFRPIAPKPVAGAPLPGGSSVDAKNSLISRGRTKRKYVRVRKYNRKKKITNSDDNKESEIDQNLQLAASLSGGSPTNGAAAANQTERSYLHPVRNGNGMIGRENGDVLRSDRTERGRGGRAGELWVTVECVTDACMDLELGSTDEERMGNLEVDTCPGFISDGSNRVQWLNAAFKRMVRQRQRERSEGDGESAEIAVWFISKPKLPYLRRGFTCQIKLQYKWGVDVDRDSKIVPCDVWRMDGGGFAWKLDVKAALSLGPPLQAD